MPRKINACTGNSTYQYSKPGNPTGSNTAVWWTTEPLPAGTTSNSSQARPGTFISAASLTRRPGSKASTRQKSRASPTASALGSRRPRRIPTPPVIRSIAPLIRHAQVA
jgi:hypothetical protein